MDIKNVSNKNISFIYSKTKKQQRIGEVPLIKLWYYCSHKTCMYMLILYKDSQKIYQNVKQKQPLRKSRVVS